MSLMLKLAIFIRNSTQAGIDLTAMACCRGRLIVVLVARKEAGRLTLWTRHWTDFNDRLPRIAEAVRSLPVHSTLIDGEAVVFRHDGHSDFGALRTKDGAGRAAFVAFDLLSIEGADDRRVDVDQCAGRPNAGKTPGYSDGLLGG